MVVTVSHVHNLFCMIIISWISCRLFAKNNYKGFSFTMIAWYFNPKQIYYCCFCFVLWNTVGTALWCDHKIINILICTVICLLIDGWVRSLSLKMADFVFAWISPFKCSVLQLIEVYTVLHFINSCYAPVKFTLVPHQNNQSFHRHCCTHTAHWELSLIKGILPHSIHQCIVPYEQ